MAEVTNDPLHRLDVTFEDLCVVRNALYNYVEDTPIWTGFSEEQPNQDQITYLFSRLETVYNYICGKIEEIG